MPSVETKQEMGHWVCSFCTTVYPHHHKDCNFHPTAVQKRDRQKRILYPHLGCGGNITKEGNCSYCDKCKEYFCGCSCG